MYNNTYYIHITLFTNIYVKVVDIKRIKNDIQKSTMLSLERGKFRVVDKF